MALPFFLLTAALLGLVVFSTVELWRHDPVALLWILSGYFIYEIGLRLLLVTAAGRGLRRRSSAPPPGNGAAPPLTILIAAHNERGCIEDTLETVFAQTGAVVSVIVASDGSTDGMNEFLIERFALRQASLGKPLWAGEREPRLRLLALPKLGKGGVLNAALAETFTELAVTLDADTRLAPGALEAIATAFRAPEVVSAGGFVYVRNAVKGQWLVRYQYWEYVENFMWRIGLVHMGVCLQVSGAFGAFRTQVLRELGGFSEHTLVEDYEIIYRLHERSRLAGKDYRVEVVPGAVAYTESPDTIPSFIHQRTRWFAGFLQTLWDYRRLVGNPRMGAVGLIMLPIKCIDAILPIWGFLSLAILLGATLCGCGEWQAASGILFAGKCCTEFALSGLMWTWHRRLSAGRPQVFSGIRLAGYIATQGLIFNWFRQIAVLNAYGWFVRRVRKWHQPRWKAHILAIEEPGSES